jgi:hypothetical protein
MVYQRKAGYLANIFNVPPLIFRFQFNPESITDKKSFNYESAENFGQWGFDQTSSASGFFGTLGGLYKDVAEISSNLIGTKPLQAKGGGPRSISMDFHLDASVPGPRDGDLPPGDGAHYGGSILPDLAVLRSFMYPSWDIFDIGKAIFGGGLPCWNTPPTCSLSYGGISATCVMRDLNIKIVSFQSDGTPLRAEVSVTLEEQPFSASPLVEYASRTFYYVPRSYGRKGFGDDFLNVTPVIGAFR